MIKAILQGQKPTASEVKFADGETFQEKLNSGELTGPAGAPGDTWVPTVSEEGVISWAKNAGEPSQNVNIKGPAGSNGKDGSPGAVGPAGPNEISTSTKTTMSGLLKGDGEHAALAVRDVDYVSKEYVDKYLPHSDTVTLTVEGWKDKVQMVSASHVTTDPKQEVRACFDGDDDGADMDAYAAAGIMLIGQLQGSVKFRCETVPEKAITLYVNTQLTPKGGGRDDF